MTLAQDWLRRRSYHHSEFPAERIRAARAESVSIVLPTREVAGTIGPILDDVTALRDEGVVDQIVVVDSASGDGTAAIAAERGAEVHQEDELMSAYGPAQGKGDAMWRALSVCTGDIVLYLDSDSEEFGRHFVLGMLGPIVCEPGVQFVKGYYRRPFRSEDGGIAREGGGRVTELAARPLLNMFWPELAGFFQPLAGEIAARRALFERVPFPVSYAIETAMLIDVYREVGLDALAQVDLEVRQNRHQPLSALTRMAYSVLQAAATRLEREGRLTSGLPAELLVPGGGQMEAWTLELVERPPMASVRAAT